MNVMADEGTNPTFVSAHELARHLDLSRARVVQLSNAGVLVRTLDGRFDQDTARLAYIRNLRVTRADRSAAAGRLQNAKAAEVEQRTALRRRELVPQTDAAYCIDTFGGIVLTELCGMPARLTRDLALRREVEVEVEAMRDRIAGRLRDIISSLRTGHGP
jgi:hypothetical protein